MVTELGIVTLVKLVLANALAGMLVSELEMSTLVKLLQLKNALMPIDVTELGIVTLGKLVHL